MDPFEISTRRHGAVETVTLRGSLVLGTPVLELDSAMENLVAHGSVRFVLNLSEVKRLDSSGIGLLVRVLQLAKTKGGTVKLVSPSKTVAMALKMCQVLPLFQVYDTDEAALSSFAQ